MPSFCRQTGWVSLRQAKAFAICPRAMAAKAEPDARRQRARGGDRCPGPAAAVQHGNECGERAHTASVTPKTRRALRSSRPSMRLRLRTRPDMKRRLGGSCPQREGRQHVGADIERQHLQHADCQRQLSAGQRPGGEGRQFGDIVSQVVGQETSVRWRRSLGRARPH